MLERGEVTVQRTTTYGTFVLGAIEPGNVFGEGELRDAATSAAPTPSRPGPASSCGSTPRRWTRLIEANPELGVQLYWSLWHSLARKLRSTNEQLKSFFSAEAAPENFLRLRKQASGARGGGQDRGGRQDPPLPRAGDLAQGADHPGGVVHLLLGHLGEPEDLLVGEVSPRASSGAAARRSRAGRRRAPAAPDSARWGRRWPAGRTPP